MTASSDDRIRLRGVRQNNLKGFDLDLPLNQLIVVTGVSGSGKSSLAFDTVYAEGQRRYVETFSPYARQFLDRMERPRAERIEGIPPAIAIDQVNPVRTSRSTVGTMTELNDHLKLLYARAARLYSSATGRAVQRDTPETILTDLLDKARASNSGELRIQVRFHLAVPPKLGRDKLHALLAQQGYVRVVDLANEDAVEVIQDRLRLPAEPDADTRSRTIEALEQALDHGKGRVAVYPLDADREPAKPWRYSSDLHCADADIHYREPIPNLFSFNSAVGACPACRGFGRTIGIDYDLVVPDATKSLLEGAIKPIQTDSYSEVQEDLMGYAFKKGVPTDVPWQDLTDADRAWIIHGDGDWEDGVWYGLKRFFAWLESRAYKMHIRVLLSKYRSYDVCSDCGGARLIDEALDWRLGDAELAAAKLPPEQRLRHSGISMSDAAWRALPGLSIHDLMGLAIADLTDFFARLRLGEARDQALDQLLEGIRARLRYLCEVGLGYLTLDRQSRTLSGGEVQRINLTTALGTALVDTLFVLDEPSIGLHPRDMERIVAVLARLRDAGNSLLVVEHDPQVMIAADRLLEIGPGPGERGGELVFQGTPAALMAADGSLTGEYLSGRRRIEPDSEPEPPEPDRWLRVLGACANNLKNIDVAVPLNRMVVMTGVSGSGKSTLVQDLLYQALCKLKGHPHEQPGEHRAIEGADLIDDVVLLDQSPLGRTARSNPASVVGALDPIRKRFAAEPLAKERGYTAGTFSFNSGNGRCPTCSGSGHEQVEMQFLSDVYLRCPDCDGRRYRRPVLDVELIGSDGHARSIADVLELTVEQAAQLFRGERDLQRALDPLIAVGLGYLQLGQPVPTLSGGEAQRLKLAGHLAKARGRRQMAPGGLLFLLDEPTTGLHFDDIATLLKAFRRLLRQGHSLLIIEHNLDVIRAADWLIDLGPEGGDDGGELIAAGPPAAIIAEPRSHTARALAGFEQQRDRVAEQAASYVPTTAAAPPEAIRIVGAREHNLQSLDVAIPRGKFTVITGVSGSGKSTLAFDVLFNEGQRRYLESLNAYARQFVEPASRADCDAVIGVPPTVAIEQRTSRGGHKSTVATLTEIHHFLRLLFTKVGVQHCPDCAIPIRPQTPEAIRERLLDERFGQTVQVLAPLVVARKGLYNELAAWAERTGHLLLRVDGEPTPVADWPKLDRYREHDIDLPLGEVELLPNNRPEITALLTKALEGGKGLVRVVDGDGQEQSYSTKRACPGCGRSFEEPDPRLFSFNSKHGWCESCFGTGAVLEGFDAEHSGEESQFLDGDQPSRACPSCAGGRLRPEALAVRLGGQSIADLSRLGVSEASAAFADIGSGFDARERAIGAELIDEIRSRLGFLDQLGLGYLGLDRAAPSLSGGEAQRIRLTSQLGSNLRGVCYVLDEPTIGLHPRDNALLLEGLSRLQHKGNTLVVVEHDDETMRRADHIIDLGPGAGLHGGRVVAEGTAAELAANPDSITGRYLARTGKPAEHEPTPPADWLGLRGARLHNLNKLNLKIPLGRLVCITGVSGSGKSTLVREVLHKSLKRLLAPDRKGGTVKRSELHGCTGLTGWQSLTRVLEVDQAPIGKTPRSCPATYIGVFDRIRKLFAATNDARMLGWGPGRFSFNTKGGRCEACDGNGEQRLEMSFLPDVRLPCDVCGGSRFNAETRTIRYLGHDIGQLLNMSVEQASELFHAHPSIRRALSLLTDVGLGYLTLGQQSPTLSGGEAQRIKLVAELAKARTDGDGLAERPTLYLLDEPTVGLHMADVERLIGVLRRLVAAGHSVVVIEHNLDLMAAADWLIDLGPEGGDGGGRLVAEGAPTTLAGSNHGHTAEALQQHLGRAD